MTPDEYRSILEAVMMAAEEPVSLARLQSLFDEPKPAQAELKKVLAQLKADYQARGIELQEVASGYRFQVRQEYAQWIRKLWQLRPPRYSRALLEVLSLIAYRQPVTRAEIEEIRGSVVSTNIMKILLEREWVQVVGHRDVPGRPALYATTKQFLDYFNLKTLAELPALAELQESEGVQQLLLKDEQNPIQLQVDDAQGEEDVEPLAESMIEETVEQE